MKQEEAEALLPQVNAGWKMVEGKKLQRQFSFGDFLGAMAFVNHVAKIAETEGHHPDIYIFYNKVRLELWTHASNGLTENDFILAAKIDEIHDKPDPAPRA
jgi:4a-hydroxytetrahydrobiopterin dehydratase